MSVACSLGIAIWYLIVCLRFITELEAYYTASEGDDGWISLGIYKTGLTSTTYLTEQFILFRNGGLVQAR